MSLYLWQLHHHETEHDKPEQFAQHVTAPVSGTTEAVTVAIAHDDSGDIRSQAVTILLSDNQQQRAEQVLRHWLSICQTKDASHPLTATAEIREVYLVTPGIAVVDVNSAFADGQTSGVLAEELTVVSLAQTLSINFPGLSGIKILVDGKERDTLAGHFDISTVIRTSDVAQIAKQIGPQ